MEIRELRYFLAVAREQSITSAAEKLHITQPALSKQLMNLEDELGKKLFIRGKRKITLTEDGLFLRKRAQEIVDLTDKTEADFQSESDTISGEIYIGAGETTGMRIITKAIRELHELYPDVKFHLYSGDDEITTERLDKGLLDFGVFVGMTNLSKYDYLKLPVVNLFGLLIRKDDPLAKLDTISPDTLKNIPLIVPRQVMLQNDLASWLGRGLEQLNLVGTYNLLYNASLMVEDKIGYALCIDGLIENDLLCYRPLAHDTTAGVVFAWKKYQVFSRATKKLLEILQARVM